jgi:hypothetical protein
LNYGLAAVVAVVVEKVVVMRVAVLAAAGALTLPKLSPLLIYRQPYL